MSSARDGAGETSDDELFRAYRDSGDRAIRNRIVERHTGLAIHIAGQRAGGRSDEDLRQVALLGLVKAVDRFDPDHGAAFSSFAGLTIEGELKRHFRDHTWVVRVPRSAKELHLSVRTASDELAHLNGRSPTVEEIAARLGVDRDDVLRGLAAASAYRVTTLDGVSPDGPGIDHSSVVAVDDDGFDGSDDRHVVEALLDRLPEREREIVRMRFYDGLSQSEIATRVGVSQMQVSRLLRQSFERMRDSLND